MSNIRAAINEALDGFGGMLRCEVCHRTQPLGDPGSHTATGLPRCCGYTMRWWTQRQIDAGETPAAMCAVADPREQQDE